MAFSSTATQENGVEPASQASRTETIEQVVIAGGGPVGLLLATVLAYYGVKSVLFERNETTTRSATPKEGILHLELESADKTNLDLCTDGRRWISLTQIPWNSSESWASRKD